MFWIMHIINIEYYENYFMATDLASIDTISRPQRAAASSVETNPCHL